MIISLVTLFSILFAGLVWYRPLLAVQLTLFSLPAYLIRFNIGIPVTLLEVMILLNFGIWFLRNISNIRNGLRNRLQKKSIVLNYPFSLEMSLLVIAGFIGAGVANFSNDALGIWKAYFFEPVLFILVIYQVIARLEIPLEEKLTKVFTPLMWSALVVSALAIYQKITGNLIDNALWQAASTRRVVSVFGYPNAVGLFLETIIIYSFGVIIFFKTKRRNKILASSVVIMASMAILFAKSNGAALGLVAGLSVFAILYSKRSRLAFLILTILGAGLIVGSTNLRTKSVERLALNDFSGRVRLIGWQDTWKMLSDNRMLLGAGLSSFQNTVAPYHVPGFYFNKDKDPDFQRKLVIFNQVYRDKYWQPLEIYMYPHNIVLNFWSEIGLFGLLVVVLLLARFYYFSAQALSSVNRPIAIITITAMTTILVHGLVDVPFFKNDLAVIFWLPIVVLGLQQLGVAQSNLKETQIPSKIAK